VAIETGRGLLVAALRTGKRPVFAINPLAAARYRDRHGGLAPVADPAVDLDEPLSGHRNVHRGTVGVEQRSTLYALSAVCAGVQSEHRAFPRPSVRSLTASARSLPWCRASRQVTPCAPARGSFGWGGANAWWVFVRVCRFVDREAGGAGEAAADARTSGGT
jgi:hypothetical protein